MFSSFLPFPNATGTGGKILRSVHQKLFSFSHILEVFDLFSAREKCYFSFSYLYIC